MCIYTYIRNIFFSPNTAENIAKTAVYNASNKSDKGIATIVTIPLLFFDFMFSAFNCT